MTGGPVFSRIGFLYFCDIPNQKIMKWERGQVTTFREKSNKAIDLTFDQLYGELRELLDLDYDPRRGEYLHGYLDWDEIIFLHNHGFFTPQDPRWVEMWRILKEWRPYMSQELNPTGMDFVKEFVTQKGAMYWSHSMTVSRLVKDPSLGFEWGIFYLPPITPSYSRFARGKEQCSTIWLRRSSAPECQSATSASSLFLRSWKERVTMRRPRASTA